MPMQTAHGLFHQQNMSITSPWKKRIDMRLKPISLRPKYCTHSPHFTVCGRAGFRKSYISFFFFSIQQSRGSDSSYISRWIDLCFQQSSPLLVCWLVERWQIGFHSLHEGAQWSGFDRVKRNSASMPPTPPSLFFLIYTHRDTHIFPPVSLLFFPGA